MVKYSYNISEKIYNDLVNNIDIEKLKNITIESINNEISIIESIVFQKKVLLSEVLGIENLVLKEFEENEIDYRKLVVGGLPDFNLLEDEKKIINEKISTYNINYGSIQINQNCSCCIGNKKILDKF